MYQALYRKYRPKTFDDVVGQEVVVQTLKNSILNDKINHAYLLSGPRGCGKTSIAKIFARLVNCQNPNGSIPCGTCVCCTQNNEQNLDIIEMDAASNNGVDEIREINNKVNLVPSVGKYKIYIIDEVHMLTIGAFNALLKTLEEPPSHVIFILATTDPHKVPITILSRCQRFDLKKISEDKIADRIKYICKEENIQIDELAITEIAHLGDGCLRDALSILDQVISYKPENITLEDIHEVNGTISQKDISLFIEQLISKKLTDVIKSINYYNISGKSMVKITEEIIIYLRNLILSKTAPDMVDNMDLFENVKNKISVEEIICYIKTLNETLLDMKKFSNSKMLLELAVIKIIGNYVGNEELNLKNKKNTENNFPGNNNLHESFKEISEEVKLPIENSKKIVVENNIQIEKQSECFQTDLIDENLIIRINKFIDIRLSNALSNFSKKDTIELKNKLNKLNDYLMDEKLGNIASILLDGELKAVGNNYIIFTYTTSNLVNLFIENIVNIELLLENVFNFNYKVVAVDIDKWNEIKESFNSKKTQYKFMEETENIEDILKKLNPNKSDSIQSTFGELVEYE